MPQRNSQSMREIYLYETAQLLQKLEEEVLSCDNAGSYSQDALKEIFRIMHTIKGSSGMMMFNEITNLSHSTEELLSFIREENIMSFTASTLSDILLECIDFTKIELEKLKNNDNADGNASSIINKIASFIIELKQKAESNPENTNTRVLAKQRQKSDLPRGKEFKSEAGSYFKAVVMFMDDCKMENLRAYHIVHNLKKITHDFCYDPENLDSDSCIEEIKKKGFRVFLQSEKSYEVIYGFFKRTGFLKDLQLIQLENRDEFIKQIKAHNITVKASDVKSDSDKRLNRQIAAKSSIFQNIISVNVAKLDSLMDLVGELVISEAMVTQNPDLEGLEIERFRKAAGQLRKITREMQDAVMSIRMISIEATFHKMKRIVRDMSKKLDKEVKLEIIGEETEVDKNIIESISDPVMHMVRNAVDHGIEPPQERKKEGKPETGTVKLEAKNAGNDVLIIVRDDGRGLDKQLIIERALEKGLIDEVTDQMDDRDIYSLIFEPGFSTRQNATEFSGRGVGMDVVGQTIKRIGGSVSVDSKQGEGTSITIKIPLTLAIIDGMNIKAGICRYTIPILSVRESFRAESKDMIIDPDGNEMIMVRGNCYPVIRLSDIFNIQSSVKEVSEGIMIMVGDEGNTLCLFADELLGEQQIVVKALPQYIKAAGNTRCLAGCALLGDGSISLILNVRGFYGFAQRKTQ